MRRSLRILFLFLFSCSLFLGSVKLAKADVSPYDPLSWLQDVKDYCDRRKGDQINLETWYSGKCDGKKGIENIGFSDMVRLDIMSKFLAPLVDPSATGVSGTSSKTPNVFFALGGALGSLQSERPVTTALYFQSVMANLGKHQIVQPAYAQGTGYGFKSLGPVLELWRAFRNIAYGLFILAFILYGFMIMFRFKINPQTVASFQTAIPKLVTTLLLITFSYAIAGFIIDVAYLVQEVLINVIFSLLNPNISLSVADVAKVGVSAGGAVENIAKQMASSFIGNVGGMSGPLIYILLATSIGGAIPRILTIIIPATGIPFIDSQLAGFVNNGIITFLIFIVVFIAILFTFFKLTFALIKAFVTIVINVTFAPLLIFPEVLPGSKAFDGWWKTIVANIAVFPATIICFLLSFIFLGPIEFRQSIFGIGVKEKMSLFEIANVTSNGITLPPPLGYGSDLGGFLPAGAGVRADAMMAIVGLGLFMMTPKLLEMVQEAMKTPPFKYGNALGEALQYGWKSTGGQVTGYAGGVVQTGIKTSQEKIIKSGVEAFRAGRAAQEAPVPEAPVRPGGGRPNTL